MEMQAGLSRGSSRMPIKYKQKTAKVDRWLSCALAMRLRQIEHDYRDLAEFVEKSGLSKATVRALRNGSGNPTFKTLTILSTSFNVPIWSLMGITEDEVKVGFDKHGLSFDGLSEMLNRASRNQRKSGN